MQYNYLGEIMKIDFDFAIMYCRQIKQKLQNETVTLADMLDLGTTKKFYTWFRYNQDIGRMNVAFHESKQTQSDNSEAPIEM